MAFRRRPGARRGFRRGFRGAPFAKRRQAWITSAFIESAIDITGVATTELVLLEGPDWTPGTPIGHVTNTIRRCIFNGVFSPVPAATAFAMDVQTLFWCLYVLDADDTDVIDFTNPSVFMNQHRVLASGMEGWVQAEGTATATNPNTFPGFKVNIDLKRGLPPLEVDDLLLFACQAGSNISSATTAMTISGLARILIDQV